MVLTNKRPVLRVLANKRPVSPVRLVQYEHLQGLEAGDKLVTAQCGAHRLPHQQVLQSDQ